MRLVTDNEGREILLGLTFDESQFCVEQRLKYIRNDRRSAEEKSRYGKLMARHELHCLILTVCAGD